MISLEMKEQCFHNKHNLRKEILNFDHSHKASSTQNKDTTNNNNNKTQGKADNYWLGKMI